ncbi:hypothetical protein K504DRAFT_32866 [Pleomassaria siparia CBS 279.74]|uniref:Uncharacterized protein n=1 Tax=Pleomassaria siparia CBS 279.74 TaxID=1314801 RepID=A0A6G1KTI4_9PLEO|nr:hypothetical protein K504DRAFT_32866 [Pleomassaria siparia CBS 279.74]
MMHAFVSRCAHHLSPLFSPSCLCARPASAPAHPPADLYPSFSSSAPAPKHFADSRPLTRNSPSSP